MEVEYEHTEDVDIECPHCKKKFIYTYRGSGSVDIEPPERDEKILEKEEGKRGGEDKKIEED